MAYLLQAVKWGLVIGAAALALAPLRPRLDRRYRARWRYWLWMVLAALLLLAPARSPRATSLPTVRCSQAFPSLACPGPPPTPPVS